MRITQAVVSMDGQTVLGYTRWNTVSDTYDTHGIYKTLELVRTTDCDNMGEPAASDILVQVCDIDGGEPKLPGHVVWANAELTCFTDCGWWTDGDMYGDYGYANVNEPHPYYIQRAKLKAEK